MLICKKCSTKNLDIAHFCKECGSEFRDLDMEKGQEEGEREEMLKTQRAKIVFLAVVGGLVSSLLCQLIISYIIVALIIFSS